MSEPLTVTLPTPLHAWIEQRVVSGQYIDASDYLRDLVRHDQEREARERLRKLIEEGLASGEPQPRSTDKVEQLRAIARGDVA